MKINIYQAYPNWESFAKKDISLKYLEDAYTHQLVGPPKIRVGDFISLKEYG